MRRRSTGRAILTVAVGASLGVGIPLAWFWIGSSAGDAPYVALIGGVTVSYLLLVVVVAVLMARFRVRQTRRQTTLAWDRSVSEWRDVPGEFNHDLEEMLITAAAITAVVCLALFLVVGDSGF